MKPEMMATIRDYDPSNTSDPITKAWDSTQNKVRFRNITYRVLQTIQIKLILLCVWAERAVLAVLKLKFELANTRDSISS